MWIWRVEASWNMVYRSAPGSPGRWTLCWPAGPPSPRAGSCCSDRSPSWLCLGVRPAGGRAASNLKWYNGLMFHFIHFLVDKVLWGSTLQMYPLPEAGPREARVGTLCIEVQLYGILLRYVEHEMNWNYEYIYILSTCFLELFTHPPHYLQFFSLDCD